MLSRFLKALSKICCCCCGLCAPRRCILTLLYPFWWVVFVLLRVYEFAFGRRARSHINKTFYNPLESYIDPSDDTVSIRPITKVNKFSFVMPIARAFLWDPLFLRLLSPYPKVRLQQIYNSLYHVVDCDRYALCMSISTREYSGQEILEAGSMGLLQDVQTINRGSVIWNYQPTRMTLLGVWTFVFTYLWNGMSLSDLIRLFRINSMAAEIMGDAPYLYLGGIGVDPQSQSQGFGTKLLRPMLQYADKEGLSCYLETSNPRNIPFYRRNGFEIVRTVWFDEKDREESGLDLEPDSNRRGGGEKEEGVRVSLMRRNPRMRRDRETPRGSNGLPRRRVRESDGIEIAV